MDVGVLVGVMVVLIIFGFIDYEMFVIFDVVKVVGVKLVGYVVLCLLYVVKDVFSVWFD